MSQAIYAPQSEENDCDLKILDQYVKSAPSPQLALNIFDDEWASRLPDHFRLKAGKTPLFEDVRINWMASQFDGLAGKRILELGPLEAGHTYMMERLGAASITAVESNTRAYLKCLIIKEVLGMQKAKFLLGDITEYLQQQPGKFEICVASGVLYHMENPAELIYLLSKTAEQIFIWTHYYDSAILSAKPQIASRFSIASPIEYKGFRHTLHRQEYGSALGYAGFCGGSRPFSSWMERAEILACLEFFGFGNINIGLEVTEHPNGPCFNIAARRSNK
jgi:hypothetical protein